MATLTLSTTINPEDYEPLFLLDYQCFQDIPEIVKAFFPGGLDPAHRSANIESMKYGVFGGPNRVYAKITSSSPPSSEIAAFVSCQIYRGPRGLLDDIPEPAKTTTTTTTTIIDDSENKEPSSASPAHPQSLDDAPSPSEDSEFYAWYWKTMHETLLCTPSYQVPHISIQVIATSPKHQRLGAGAMMMNWCMDLARKEGIGRVVLHASPFAAGIGFYEKFGFQRGEVLRFVDEVKFPGRVGTEVVVMWRDV